MIPKAKALKLIAIYLYVCELYDQKLQYSVQRYSNNNKPLFTDQEIMTVYIFTLQQEQRFTISRIHAFADDYLRSWFPNLPSYQAFNNRINRLGEAFRILAAHNFNQFLPESCSTKISLLDSLPIITCSGKRKAKVALEITNKGYCATKSMYFHGLKLHALAFSRPKQLPFPERIVITAAAESDLNVFKQEWEQIPSRIFIGDKIYSNKEYFRDLEKRSHSVMVTPVRAVKDQPEVIRQRNKAADDQFSAAVSRIRQPIESIFNWIIEKTDIQRASKVRSTNGLFVHVFGKIAAAFIYLIF